VVRDTGPVAGEDADVVRGAFEAISAAAEASTEERKRLTERWFHPEVEYTEDPSWPGSTSYRGLEVVRETFEGYGELLSAKLTVNEVREGSNGVFALIRYEGASTGAEIPFDQLWGYHCRVREGKLAYFRAYFDLDQAKRDAGVS
jgi:ketosteroid isomerase-like protein